MNSEEAKIPTIEVKSMQGKTKLSRNNKKRKKMKTQGKKEKGSDVVLEKLIMEYAGKTYKLARVLMRKLKMMRIKKK